MADTKVNTVDTETVSEVEKKAKEPSAKKKTKKKFKMPIWGKVAIVILVVAIAFFGFRACKSKSGKTTEQPTATVSYGSVTQVIEGEGTITVDRYSATSLVRGEIIACYIEEGDYVEKDQVLYEIDSGDMENSITRAENSLESAQDNYDNILEDMAELNITAPIDGVIKEMYVRNGDQVNNGTVIADIIDSSVLKLKINFLQWDAEKMHKGSPAEVTVSATGEKLYGTVTRISTGALVNADGVAVSNVEIQVPNPGALLPGTRATATVGEFACSDSGTFEYMASEKATAKQSGKIRNLAFDTADKIAAGECIATIENTTLKNSLKSAESQLENAKLSLDDLYDTLDNYKIKSTISGKVIQKNSKVGDKIDNTNSQTVLAVVSDPSELSFEMVVDELDISQIKEGQEVVVTASALTSKTFKGYVDTVSEIGSASNGVTTYPVKIIVEAEEDSGLIPGMNVDAIITIASRYNVLTVPNSAIQRGNIVYVKEGSPSLENKDSDNKGKESEKQEEKKNTEKSGDKAKGDMGKMPEGMTPPEGMTSPEGRTPPGGMKKTEASGGNVPQGGNSEMQKAALERMQKNAPEGFVAVQVQVGLSDDNNIEIISGLAEGDIVAVQEKQMTTNRFGMMGGGMPMMGGGMHGGMAGGMPSGGMSGGNRGGMPGGR